MAGVARYTRIFDVGIPIGINVLCHLNHCSRNIFGINRIVCKVLHIVAIAAAFIWRNPSRHCHHETGELSLT